MLFTVTATFSDFARAVEQYECDSPEAAVTRFVETAEAMDGYDRTEWLARPSDRLELIHLAGGLRGVWLWHSLVDLVDDDDVAMYGGLVVQTDPSGLLRPAA